MKHTEGEWVVKPNPSDSKKYGIWSQHPTRGTSLIAMAHMDFMTEEEFKSNAKLIAAAPDLLEACNGALQAFKDDTRSPRRIQANINAIERAIKKAEGEA